VFLYNERFANIILLGNKCDLKDKAVDQQKIKEYCKKYKIDYYETSAKMKTNITKVFNKIAEIYDEAVDNIEIGQ
jgi:GTPase SAR1 family protein